MRIAVAADERVAVAKAIGAELERRGHEVLPHGALSENGRDGWAWASEAAARDLAEGRGGEASTEGDDRANVAHLDEIEGS